jgi:hypothetical protein
MHRRWAGEFQLLREATATVVIADTGTFELDAAPNQGWRIIVLLTDRQ